MAHRCHIQQYESRVDPLVSSYLITNGRPAASHYPQRSQTRRSGSVFQRPVTDLDLLWKILYPLHHAPETLCFRPYFLYVK